MRFDLTFAMPGFQDAVETAENQFWYGRYEHQVWRDSIIVGSARDTGNTSATDVLRSGLLLGMVTATHKLTAWNPTANDGSENIYGILLYAQKVTANGSNVDRFTGFVMVGGFVKAANLLIPGNSSLGISGDANEYLVRTQMARRFQFDDDMRPVLNGGWHNVVAKTADYTVLESDHDVLFTNRGAAGAVNFTLPATPRKGLRFGFYVVAGQTVTVTPGTADTLVGFNDAGGDSVAFSTSSEKIGGMIEIVGDGTGWLTIMHLGAETQTPTIAT